MLSSRSRMLVPITLGLMSPSTPLTFVSYPLSRGLYYVYISNQGLMELVNPESHSLYRIEVSKVAGESRLFVPENNVGGMGRSRYRSLPQIARVQANLEGVHSIIRPVCVSL